ncbi:uncharacterized protein LOC119676875 [Teleopsis dalmanni]|uniref:uncharacterized protein LOC119676874 n=1 Tax=Teleopsis dalmanni TaxID=139649 RepID=UPI0018CD0A25|nr:uncharacterized protein LOC119676874 [Teleopsis dalmanni]XP_037944061.1 uncharacterized protein LOC119676875 [Teleopsis dalmanni]
MSSEPVQNNINFKEVEESLELFDDIAPEELGAVGGSEPALTLSTQLKESEERDRAEERMRRYSLLIAELRAEVSSLTAQRDTLMQAHASTNNLPTFPLGNVGEFERLEAHLLLYEEMREKLKQSFLQLEVDDAESFVPKALRSVLPDGVASHFTLRGRGMKSAIGQSLFIKTIRASTFVTQLIRNVDLCKINLTRWINLSKKTKLISGTSGAEVKGVCIEEIQRKIGNLN